MTWLHRATRGAATVAASWGAAPGRDPSVATADVPTENRVFKATHLKAWSGSILSLERRIPWRAVLVFLGKEPGWAKMEEILRSGEPWTTPVNLGAVAYILPRASGTEAADEGRGRTSGRSAGLEGARQLDRRRRHLRAPGGGSNTPRTLIMAPGADSRPSAGSGRVTAMTRRPGRTMGRGGGTWLVLSRDVSDSVRIDGEPSVRAAMVLDMDTGLVRGVTASSTESGAVAQAAEMGLTKPAGSLPPGRPDEVLCAPELEALIIDVLSALLGDGRLPPVRAVAPPPDAEDIFDSFVGHMSGRPQPSEPPNPSDWELLFRQALEFARAAPWTRWDDGIVLALETSIDQSRVDLAAVVMGNSGIQHGLVLFPGGQVPAGLDDWEPGLPVPMPPGTLSVMLDPPSDLPSDLRNKAFRYGWPPDAELVPAVLRLGREGGGDPGRADTQVLAVALAAVTVHDARGPVAIGSAHQVTTGGIVLGDGRRANYSITQKPPAPAPDVARLRVHRAGADLVPQGTPVVLGHLPWSSVTALRAVARLHRPLPAEAPRRAGAEVPLLAILPKPGKGESIAARVAELDPYGVTPVHTDDGQEVFVLAGTNGAQLLMEVPADDPSMSDFRRRMTATRGLHVVMVADESTSRGEGAVYGLFECHQPLPEGPPQTDEPRGGTPSRRPK